MSSLQSIALRAKTIDDQKEELLAEFKDIVLESECTPVDFKGVDAEGFLRLKKLISVLRIDGNMTPTQRSKISMTKDNVWPKCFSLAQVDNAAGLPAMLDTKTLHTDEADLMRVPLIQLLKDNPKEEWCVAVANLENLSWSPDEIKQFPIELCRAYIKAHHEVEPRTFEYDRDPVWLGEYETFLCHLLVTFFDRLIYDERVRAARQINQHSIQTCPLGSNIRKIALPQENGVFDLLASIVTHYSRDPLSLECRYRRQLHAYHHDDFKLLLVNKVHDQCVNSRDVEYRFPDLCYVFPTAIKIRYHQSVLRDGKAPKFFVDVHSRTKLPSCIAKLQILETTKDCIADYESQTIELDGSVCKSIQIKTYSFARIHDIEIFGHMLLLF